MNTPEGWKLVPVEPTDKMLEAAWDSDAADYVGEHKRIWQLGPAYSAMLAAAPTPPEQQCGCGDRPASLCPGEWEPGCDLGANEKYVRVSRQPPPEQQAAQGELTDEQIDEFRRARGSFNDMLRAVYAAGIAAARMRPEAEVAEIMEAVKLAISNKVSVHEVERLVRERGE